MLKYKADVRSLVYMAVTTAMFVYQWNYGFSLTVINVAIYIAYLHMSVAVSVMAHNHNHINMWNSKPLNILTDWWLTVFYGIPVFCWIPTHNRNHHRYNNKPEDYTSTFKKYEDNTLFTLTSYPSISSYYQIKEGIIPYMKMLWKDDRKMFWEYMFQVFLLYAWIVVFLIIDWKKAILYVVIPQQISGQFVMFFNYVQHVHADEESKLNHSRNFLWVNAFLFNNGLHTVHHEKASVHWSETPAAHAKVAHLIDPKLIERSFWGYIFRVYIFGPIFPSGKTKSMRLERIAKQQKEVEMQPEPVH
jgi:beta-carotene hydroxylase